MRVGASPIQTYLNGSIPSQDRLRQQSVQPAVGEPEKARAREAQLQVDQEVEISEAARRVAQQRDIAATEKPARSQRNYQYYPFPNHSNLSASQQKALQTYSNNQSLSRTDNSGDFLGSIDLFA